MSYMYSSASCDEREADDRQLPSMKDAGRTYPSLHRSPSPDSPATADGIIGPMWAGRRRAPHDYIQRNSWRYTFNLLLETMFRNITLQNVIFSNFGIFLDEATF